MRTFLLSVLCALACGCTNRQTIVLTIEGGLEEVRLSYDPSRIAPPLMDESVRLSPFSEGQLVPPQLELCIAGDPDYFECGSRNLGSSNFFAYAAVNIKRGQGMLDFLDRVKLPPVLEPVRQFRRRETSFWLCLERRASAARHNIAGAR